MKKQIFKYGSILLLSLFSLQLITLKVFSENQKASTIIEDLNLFVLIDQLDSLAFHTNIITNEYELASNLESRFSDTIDYLVICELEQWYEYRGDSNYLAIEIIDSSKVKFIFEAHTEAGTLYYGESWYNKYIWILYKWFKLEHKNTGIS